MIGTSFYICPLSTTVSINSLICCCEGVVGVALIVSKQVKSEITEAMQLFPHKLLSFISPPVFIDELPFIDTLLQLIDVLQFIEVLLQLIDVFPILIEVLSI